MQSITSFHRRTRGIGYRIVYKMNHYSFKSLLLTSADKSGKIPHFFPFLSEFRNGYCRIGQSFTCTEIFVILTRGALVNAIAAR